MNEKAVIMDMSPVYSSLIIYWIGHDPTGTGTKGFDDADYLTIVSVQHPSYLQLWLTNPCISRPRHFKPPKISSSYTLCSIPHQKTIHMQKKWRINKRRMTPTESDTA